MHPCPAPKCRDIDGNAALTDAPMCPHHTVRVAQAVDDLPTLYATLHTAMARGDAVGDGMHVSVSKTPPLPINVTARALQEDMLAVTAEAEGAYRRAMRWSVGRGATLPPHVKVDGARRPQQGRELPTLVARCKFVGQHLGDILALDVTIGVRLLSIKHSVRVLLGNTRLIHRLDAPCPECDSMALVRENGSSYVECRACGLAFDEANYRRLTLLVAADLPAQDKPRRKTIHATDDDHERGYGW